MILEQIIQAAIVGTSIDTVQLLPVRLDSAGKCKRPKVLIWQLRNPRKYMRLGKFLTKYTSLSQAEIHKLVENYKRGAK